MPEQTMIRVSRLLDERGLSSFHYSLIFWCVLLSLIDGYDIAAIAFAAPHLMRDWHLTDRSALGPVFSASLVGILFGSALFGWIGDRWGRKVALIASNVLFGVFTLAAAWSTNLEQLSLLRLLAGLGIGGVIPNIVALNAESSPRRLRATVALIGVGFVPLGGAIPGLVAGILVPTYGWQILFTLGGILPIVLAVLGTFTLPESIKFMALHESQRGKMEKTIRKLDPNYVVPPNAKFVIEDEQQFPGFNPVYLFKQGLWLITPLLWLLFALNLMGYYFLLSWTPTLMAVLKLPPSVGAMAGAMIQVGGTVGSLALSRWFQQRQFLAIAIVFVIAVPAVASIGYAGVTSTTALAIATFFAGFCVLGIQTGINVVGALVYPTSLRANGSGWELGIGRVGSIVGPMLGALFTGMSVEKLYVWSAIPFAIGAVVCFAIYRLNEERLAKDPDLR
ncbi:MAG: MFS transporter [Pseudolabrys sp.]|nr:MFS transporter [Pseudolabrys sp.]